MRDPSSTRREAMGRPPGVALGRVPHSSFRLSESAARWGSRTYRVAQTDSREDSSAVRYQYHSLEDFLIAEMLTVDAQVDDGWGAFYPVKGREIEATVLFADITGFSGRTAALDPTETLAFVIHFFAWISAEALRGRPGIVDKYIGHEVMIVCSKEFGSDDPFVDAVQAARFMGQSDVFSFLPHVGIASRVVIVGYVGTPLKYNCSVFGAPVALAARCAGVSSNHGSPFSSSITFPASDWATRDFGEVFPPRLYVDPDGSTHDQQHAWSLLAPRSVEMKRRCGYGASQPRNGRARRSR